MHVPRLVLGIRHQYHLFETDDVIRVEPTLEFGGASVTIPQKGGVLKYLGEISESARQIGAVNELPTD